MKRNKENTAQADANNQTLSVLTDVLLTLSCLAILATQLMLWILK